MNTHMIQAVMLLAVMASLPSENAASADNGKGGPIYFYDMTSLFDLDLKDAAQRRRFWDETHLVVSLQGLANREKPVLYLRYNTEPDDFWWKVMTDKGGWLAGREVVQITSLEDLLTRLKGFYTGAAVWDERVPATSNLAATLAGIESLLCLRYDASPGSLYDQLVNQGPKLKVAKSFMGKNGEPMFNGKGTVPETNQIPSTGSIKCDPYIWLIENLVKTGKANPHRMGYYLDGAWLEIWDRGSPQNHTLTNQDYVIANKGILFDLNVWEDETPVDDRAQKPGTDVATLKALLRAAYDQFKGDGVIHAAGFVPWAYKYTNVDKAGGTHDPVPTEWRYAEILSCYNAYMDADALGLSAMSNASFYQHCPLPEKIPQNPKPTRESLIAKGLLDSDGKVAKRHFVSHYVGDYDAAAWLYRMLPQMWNDPARGKVPLNWAFNPNLAERFPLGMLWSRELRTPNDIFIAGDSGAGYLNPGNLSEPRAHSGLPSGIAAWEKHNRKFFEQWDLSLVGFVIDGYAPGLSKEGLDSYARFSPDGIVAQKVPEMAIHNGMPILRMKSDLPQNAKEAALIIVDESQNEAPSFSVYRSILMTPSWYESVSSTIKAEAGDAIEVIDMRTLLALAKAHMEYVESHPRPASEFASQDEVFITPEKSAGIRTVRVDDGPFDQKEIEGKAAWVIGENPKRPYFYLAIDDDFTKKHRDFSMEITLLDKGEGSLTLEYDADDRGANMGGAYKAGPSFKLENSGQWVTKTIPLPDGRFLNSQNRRADFRFIANSGAVWIQKIALKR